MSNIIFKDSYVMKEHKDGMLSNVDFNNIIEIIEASSHSFCFVIE